MLPFKYGIIEANEYDQKGRTLKVSGFEYELDISVFTEKMIEIKKEEYKHFPSYILEDGFLILRSNNDFQVRVFGCDLDGNMDGIYEEIRIKTDAVFFVEINPVMKLGLKLNCGEIAGIHLKLKKGERAWDSKLKILGMATEAMKMIKSQHICMENISKYCNFFYENSYLTINTIMESPPNFVNFSSWIQAGPADYRSFKYLPYDSKQKPNILDILNSREFMFWLENVTGLPIKRLSRPAYLRKIENAGDYQILHGNYSEPFGLDLVYNFYRDEKFERWEEDVCGRIHYLDDGGNEIFQVPVENNSLTLVYRTQGTTRFLENLKGSNNEPLIQGIALYEIEDEE